jgi:hypothetical protein
MKATIALLAVNRTLCCRLQQSQRRCRSQGDRVEVWTDRRLTWMTSQRKRESVKRQSSPPRWTMVAFVQLVIPHRAIGDHQVYMRDGDNDHPT